MSQETIQQQGQQQVAAATLRHDPVSHYHWLDYGGFPGQEVHDLLKREGWRWSRYREQYYTNRRWAQPPAGIPYVDAGACDYSAERADRLEVRAERHQELSNAAYARSNALVEHIPLGQPILRGHHSERGHRATLEKSRRAMDRFVEEDAIARDLTQRAEASRRHQQVRADVGKLVRRRDKLAAELRKLEREKAQYGAESERWARMTAEIRAEIDSLQGQIDAAGGEPGKARPGEAPPFKKGDMIKVHGYVGVVTSLGPKTVTIMARDDWPLKLDRSRFQGVVATAEELAARREA